MSTRFIQSLEARQLFSASVYTYHNDNARDGANLSDTVLTPSDVNTNTFGKLFSLPVDGQIYAQPLFVNRLKMADGQYHNVVFVATEHDDVYAFDAVTGKQLWYRSFIDPSHGITTVSSAQVNSTDIDPEIGITGTPVIDPHTNTMYLVTKESVTSGGTTTVEQFIRSIDITTGKDQFAGSKMIQASVPGAGEGYTGPGDSMVPFDALTENQRPALLLTNGVVYVGYASHGDNDPYHGWLFAYQTRTLNLNAVLNFSPDGLRAPIWMGAAGPAADSSGNIFVATGNGTYDAAVGGRDYGDSILRLSTAHNGLSIADAFTPDNQAYLNENDKDMGSAGVVLLPNNEAITGDKAGDLYLVNTQNLGGFSLSKNNDLQTATTGLNGKQDYSTVAYYNGAVYLAGNEDKLEKVDLVNGKLATTPAAQSPETYGYPGATPSISANGNKDGIVWAIDRVEPSSGSDSGAPAGNAVLNAYDASTMKELYSSAWAPNNRDQAPAGIKFSVPTIADGEVFVGTASALVIYGERPTVSSFQLVNGYTGQVLKTLTNNSTISLKSLSTQYVKVVVDTDPSPVGAAVLRYDQNPSRTETIGTYTLDLPNDVLTLGKHTISADLFDSPTATGFNDLISISINVTA